MGGRGTSAPATAGQNPGSRNLRFQRWPPPGRGGETRRKTKSEYPMQNEVFMRGPSAGVSVYNMFVRKYVVILGDRGRGPWPPLAHGATNRT
eukprot:8400925-Pyramimonas_sp.AAC.1